MTGRILHFLIAYADDKPDPVKLGSIQSPVLCMLGDHQIDLSEGQVVTLGFTAGHYL